MILGLAAAAAASFGGCAPKTADQQWIRGTRAAWQSRLQAIPELKPPPVVSVILFDGRCRYSSPDALDRRMTSRWSGTLHGGKIRLADNSSIPVGVTSFAGEGIQGSSFVMALPSIWEEAKVNGGPVGLTRLTTAVMLHEASHVAQTRLMAKVGALLRSEGFGEDFSDDSIQEKYANNDEFANAVKKETRLLFAAAEAGDVTEARKLAGEASASIRARRSRWFTGRDRGLARAEDLFLSMEGAGQYVGYSWLIDPAGGGVPRPVAMAGFGTRARWWSQAQGLALILAVERLGLPGWRQQVWGEPDLVGAQLLDAALAREAG